MGFCLGLALTGLVWAVVYRADQTRVRGLEAAKTAHMAKQLEDRVKDLAQVLQGAAGYLGRGPLPSRAEWRDYVAWLELPATYPGFQGLSFVEWIPGAELAAHVWRLRGEGFPDYALVPGGSLPPDPEGFSSIVYLEPWDARNQRAFGRDMLREPLRREAMLRARDQGLVTLSGPLTLYQEAGPDPQVGTVLFVPVYRQGLPLDSVAQRRKALRGWATFPLRMADFIQSTLARDLRSMDLALFDATGTGGPVLVFDSDPGHPGPEKAASTVHAFEVAGRIWRTHIHPNPSFHAEVGQNHHTEILLGGLTASLLLFTLLAAILGAEGRAQRLARLREEELLATEAQFRILFEKAPFGMAIVDSESGRFLSVNAHLGRILGYSPEELVARNFQSITHPEHLAADLASVQDLARGTAQVIRKDKRYLHRDGQEVWGRLSMVGLPAEEGGPARHLSIVEDITELRRSSQAVLDSESRLRILSDQLPDSFLYQYLSRPGEAPRFLYLSAGVERLCGLKAEDVVRDPGLLFGQVDPAMRSAYLEAEAASARNQTPFAMDLRQRHADGTWRWFRVRSMPRPQPDGSVLWEGISTDVTEAQHSLLKLEEGEARFRVVIEKAPVPLFLHREGRFVYLNPASLRLLKAGSAEELIGQPVLDRVHPDDRAQALERIRLALATGGEAPLLEERLLALDGSVLHVEVLGRAVTVDGQPTMLVFAQDVSGRKQADMTELRARKAESLVLMAGSIAHDFNNIFQGVLGFLEVAGIRAGENAELRLLLGKAEGSLRKAIGLSWKMLDFSGRALVKQERLDLEAWLPAFAATLQLELPATLGLEVACEPAPFILGDRVRLEEVLEALVANAREAAVPLAGRVRLRLFVDFGADRPDLASPGIWPLRRPELPATVCLEVADEGPGVPGMILERICDPFFTTHELGRGLGLASVTGILQAHRAGLHLFNGERGGFTVRMHFPPGGV
ncbi:MAG: PAS domain S-box protein [Holophagaceae bacterium]